MEILWAGLELKGQASDTLASYGFGRPSATQNAAGSAGKPERILVKQNALFVPEDTGVPPQRQQRGGAQLGLGGQQAQAAALQNARMQVEILKLQPLLKNVTMG